MKKRLPSSKLKKEIPRFYCVETFNPNTLNCPFEPDKSLDLRWGGGKQKTTARVWGKKAGENFIGDKFAIRLSENRDWGQEEKNSCNCDRVIKGHLQAWPKFLMVIKTIMELELFSRYKLFTACVWKNNTGIVKRVRFIENNGVNFVETRLTLMENDTFNRWCLFDNLRSTRNFCTTTTTTTNFRALTRDKESAKRQIVVLRESLLQTSKFLQIVVVTPPACISI